MRPVGWTWSMALFPSPIDGKPIPAGNPRQREDPAHAEIPLRPDRGIQSRPQRLAGPPVREERPVGRPGGPSDRQARCTCEGDRGIRSRLQRRRAIGSRGPIRGTRRSRSHPDVVVYNASNRVRGALVDLAPDDVKRAIEISAGALVSQQAVKRMLPKGEGAVPPVGGDGGREGLRRRRPSPWAVRAAAFSRSPR